MWRLYRKWRLIRRLRDECVRHIGNLDNGFVSVDKWGTVMVVRGIFVKQTASHWWWSKIGGEGREKVHEIDSVLDSCIADNFIETRRRDDGANLIKASVKGEDSCGASDLAESMLSRYRSTWVNIVVPLSTFIAGILGSPYVKDAVHRIIGR